METFQVLLVARNFMGEMKVSRQKWDGTELLTGVLDDRSEHHRTNSERGNPSCRVHFCDSSFVDTLYSLRA